MFRWPRGWRVISDVQKRDQQAAPECCGWSIARNRFQALDALVGSAEVFGQNADHHREIQSACGVHFFDVGPVLGSIEERLEHCNVFASEKWDLPVRKG